ncbi:MULTISPECIES: hypothetical protein [unclassified Arcicella]|uniref:hypothetical protein n=1 Tax=unclassified Arcicella TaxID=2644986 RepID=UPI00285ECD83|nr:MULTISPECIES: hypothetical protein [unclassified Arcicella]MDR6562157.1 hypothetical protein [Arcicella sp. BE51]MDR6812148.1 hypothetical protein [Arcicella sp. BE140]MDR6823460.1 hypothetical protein [Arcicella sp. BE139]
MAKKKFFIKKDEKDAKKKALEHFNTEENQIISEDVLGGFRQYGGKNPDPTEPPPAAPPAE